MNVDVGIDESGKTSLPVASMISVSGGTSRWTPMLLMVSSSMKMSACDRASAVTISPPLINNPIGLFLRGFKRAAIRQMRQ